MRTSTLESFINGIAERILSQCYYTDRLFTNSSVTLRKRYRALSDNDLMSQFSNGVWLTDLDTHSLYTLNIVKPMVRTNTAAMQNANVKIEIEPRFLKDTKSQMAADVATAILERKERLQWTDELEQQIANEQQLGPGVFVRCQYNPHKKRRHSMPQFEDVDVVMPGSAICGDCGAETPVEEDVEAIACGSCGAEAMVETAPQSVSAPVPTGYSEFATGDTQTKCYPFFEFRVDDDGTQGGKLENARWFEHHYLASLDELQLEYPESAESIQGQSMEWSYPLRWQQTLKRSGMVPQGGSESVVEQREVRDIFLTPSMYANVKMDADFQLKGEDGVRFSVKRDQTLEDAEFDGEKEEGAVICFRLIGNQVLDIYPCDFKEEYYYLGFLSDPSQFWATFLYEIVILQDIVTTVLSLMMYHIRRNAITSIVYNRSSFDPDAFDEDLIPTKNTIPPEIPISQQFGIIPALQLSGEPMQMLGAIMEMKSDVTLTTPALQGQAQPNEPYHAQLLQKQSSLGLLSPAEISKAGAKVKWAKYELKCEKKYWTDENTDELLKLNSEWNEDYVDAFLECDLDDDLIIDYVEGSEIPSTLIEKEVKLNKMFQDLLALAQVDPQLVKPEMLSQLFSEMTQATGIDLELDNAESSLRLAEARYDKLLDAIKDAPDMEMQEMSVVAQQIVSHPVFSPLPKERFDLITDFYGDKARAEAAKESPDFMLITCLVALIQLEDRGFVAEGQAETEKMLAIQQPAMALQQEQQNAAMQAQGQEQEQAMMAEQAQKEQDAVAEEDNKDFQAGMTLQEQEHEAQMKQMDMEESERDRQHQKELAKTASRAK